jgi:conjugal transfer pilus assembly protein TraD
MSGYPLENCFRPIYEWRSSAIAATGLIAIATMPNYFWPNPALGVAGAVATAGVCLYRIRQGYKVFQFQLNLRRLPMLVMTSEEIPTAKGEIYLGKGFWWNQKHTQRLYMARLPENAKYRARNDRYEAARDYERKHPDALRSKLTKLQHPLNPVAPLPPTYGDPTIHGIELNELDIFTALGERVGHTIVLGTTRVGKTRLAELLITQDIHRGDVVIVFDPKGDVELLKRMFAEAKRAGREKDFWFFHLGYPHLSDKYSPVSTIGRITEVATRIANPIPGEGNSAAFKQFVWLYVNIIARTAASLGLNPTYELIYRYAADLDSLAEQYFQKWLDREHPGWEDDMGMEGKTLEKIKQQIGRTTRIIEFLDLIGRKHWSDPVADGLVAVLSNSKTRYQALINSLFPLLEKLTTGPISELLSPKWDDVLDSRRLFDWDKIMNMGGIVYVGLDALSDAEVSAAVGNAMFADLTSTAGRRYKFGGGYGQGEALPVEKTRKVSIHADEFNELIGDEFIPLLNKAGGAGYQVVAYTQTWNDVAAKVGNSDKAAQIGGNLNTLIMLRVKNTETAEILTDQLPTVEIVSKTFVSGTSDANDPDSFSDFSSTSEDRLTTREVPMLQPSDLTQLPKGQCFALLEGGQLAKIRLPLPATSDQDPNWPSNLMAVFSGMQAQYQKYETQVETGQWEGFQMARYEVPSDFAGGHISQLTVEGESYGHAE